ncbi:MAG: type II toxin-antitoxin system VapC family toxin [Gammaproteobacteria bacterium]
MPFVIDCSVTMAWIFPDEATEITNGLRESLESDLAVVPSLWPIEVGNVLLAATRSGRISVRDWKRVESNLAALPIEVDPETSEQMWRATMPLAFKHKLSTYDATYLELAARLKLPLATLDKELRAACNAAKVEVL